MFARDVAKYCLAISRIMAFGITFFPIWFVLYLSPIPKKHIDCCFLVFELYGWYRSLWLGMIMWLIDSQS